MVDEAGLEASCDRVLKILKMDREGKLSDERRSDLAGKHLGLDAREFARASGWVPTGDSAHEVFGVWLAQDVAVVASAAKPHPDIRYAGVIGRGETQVLAPIVDLGIPRAFQLTESRQHGRDSGASAQAGDGATAKSLDTEDDERMSGHSAQQLILETSLKKEIATILRASAMVG